MSKLMIMGCRCAASRPYQLFMRRNDPDEEFEQRAQCCLEKVLYKDVRALMNKYLEIYHSQENMEDALVMLIRTLMSTLRHL